jgi:hypothetical protein
MTDSPCSLQINSGVSYRNDGTVIHEVMLRGYRDENGVQDVIVTMVEGSVLDQLRMNPGILDLVMAAYDAGKHLR